MGGSRLNGLAVKRGVQMEPGPLHLDKLVRQSSDSGGAAFVVCHIVNAAREFDTLEPFGLNHQFGQFGF